MSDNLKKKIEDILKKDLHDVEVKQEISRILDPWEEARGLLKNKKINPVDEQNRLRNELERGSK